MFAKVLAVVLLGVLATTVLAQTTPPACAVTCGTSAAGDAGCSLADTSCLCGSQTFATDVGQCIGSTCSSTDLQAAANYFAALCASVSTTASGSSGATTTDVPIPSSSTTGSSISLTAPITVLSSIVSVPTTTATSPVSSAASSASSAISSVASSVSSAISSASRSVASRSSSASASASSASSAAASSSAAGRKVGLGFGGVLGMGVALVGVLVGGLMVL